MERSVTMEVIDSLSKEVAFYSLKTGETFMKDNNICMKTQTVAGKTVGVILGPSESGYEFEIESTAMVVPKNVSLLLK